MDLYGVLHLEPNAPMEDVRKSFQRLARELHPDKNGNSRESVERFQELQQAFEVLRDASQRKAYDSTEAAASAIATKEIDLDDMLYDEARRSYTEECRCGGRYCITEQQLSEGYDTVQCDNCSLNVTVLYESEEAAAATAGSSSAASADRESI